MLRNFLVACFGVLLAQAAFAQSDPKGCGNPFVNGVGPFDYSNAAHRRNKLPIVERYHFTPEVEKLVRGSTTSDILQDLDYTLRASPNHHRALMSLAKYQLRNPGRRYDKRQTAECYFDRAMRFRPGDGNVRLIYGIYLAKLGDNEHALQRYNEALELVPSSSEAHYNLGLLYIDMNDYDAAFEHAQRAYALGFPLPGLRNKLTRLGAWKTDD